MGEYTDLIRVLLGETVKYVFLLLFAVLAIRLWRRQFRLAAGRFWNNLVLACLISGITFGIGFFSICHSLSLLYSHYARRAFDLAHWSSSLILFQSSAKYWRNADAVGGEGVCLLMLGNFRDGVELIHQARAMRHDQSTPFEHFYEGELYFYQNQPDKAVPLLEASSVDPIYFWNVTKMLTVVHLDRHQIGDARQLMKPFLQVPIQKDEPDHAYIVASLDLLDGKTNAVRTLLEEFPSDGLDPFWKPRFEQLRAKIQN